MHRCPSPRPRRQALAVLALAAITLSRAEAADFTTEDPALTIPEMTATVVGNSWSGTFEGTEFKEYIDPNGELRGVSGGESYVAHWFFREDGIFCFDYGEQGMDPGQDGCVQLLHKGDEIGWRRLDGHVEGSATLAAGNAFGL